MSTPNWIELSTHHYQTPKSIKIIMRFGLEGYGIYLALWQKLASEENRAYPLIDIHEIAFELHCDENKLRNIIINHFDTDELIFWSDELNELMKNYDDNYIKFSQAGKKAANQLTAEERKEKARKAGLASGKARNQEII